MLELTARLADEWNFPATALDRYDGRRRVLAELLPARNRPASCTSCWWFDVTMVVVAVLIEFTVNSDKPGEVWTSQPSKRRWWSRR